MYTNALGSTLRGMFKGEGSGMRQPHFENGSFLHVVRRQPARLLALTGIAFLLLLAFASAAAPQGTGTYTASVSPTSVPAGDSGTFTVTLKNTSGGLEVLGSAEITVTGGFSSVSTGPPSVSGWDSAVSGNVVQLTSSSGNEVGANGEVSVDITATAPTSTGSSEWTTEAKESTDFTGTDNNLGLSGEDPMVTVTPGPLGSFTFDAIPAQTAGTASGPIGIQAMDTFGNDKTDYNGSPALTGNLGTPTSCTPAPCPSGPNYDGDGVVDFSGGTANAAITAYVTGNNDQQLTLSDTEPEPDVESDSGTFTVTPGPLGSLTITDPAETVTSGDDFDVTVAAFDQYGNAGADGYWNSTGCVIFSGPDDSPDIAAAPLPNTAPLYPALEDCSNTPSGQSELNFDGSGQATANITLYNASTTTILTVEDATETYGDSTGSFPVNNGTAAALDFTTKPPKWVAKSPANFSAAVTVYDTWGNTIPTQDVTVSLQDNPGGATLTCPDDVTQCTVESGPDGVAPFTLRLSQDGLGYRLKATSSGATDALSNAFNAADQLGPCNAQGNCTVKGDDRPG